MREEGAGRVWLVLWGGVMGGRFNVLRRSFSVSCGPMWVGCWGIDDVAPCILSVAPNVGGRGL